MLSRSLEAELEALLDGAEYTIIGADTRRRVTPTTAEPFRHVCQIVSEVPDPQGGGGWIGWHGSGTLIAPNKVLTAAHVVYSRPGWAYARDVRVTPGRDGSGTGIHSAPFGMARALRCHVPPRYRSRTAKPGVVAANDYAVITLDTRIGDRRPRGSAVGTPPLGYWRRIRAVPDQLLRRSRLNNAGYPLDKGGNLQYRAWNDVADLTEHRIEYVNDTTTGQSGGPIWLRWQGYRVLVGIHTNGVGPAGPYNTGVRLNATNLAVIKSWVRT